VHKSEAWDEFGVNLSAANDLRFQYAWRGLFNTTTRSGDVDVSQQYVVDIRNRRAMLI
jgi:hypothetical protein